MTLVVGTRWRAPGRPCPRRDSVDRIHCPRGYGVRREPHGQVARRPMGSKQIAGFLLAHGARIDLFCAAMMGMLEMVRAVVDSYPGAVAWKGPHGISLLRHAIVGEAEEVAELLRARGAV